MLEKLRSGKVREMYRAGDGFLLMVATDRISAYDVVLDDAIPDKGKVLTGLTLFFATKVDDLVRTHIVTSDPSRFPQGWQDTPGLKDAPGRALLVYEARMLPVEFVVRGYLFGSAYEEYKATGSVAGRRFPSGLPLAAELQEPILTPTTKAEEGHDEPIDYAQAAALCGKEAFHRAAQASIEVYSRARKLAQAAGVIIADTKFEFGIVDGELVLADEILTPDSSRFWDAASYQPGQSPRSFDKQFVRDYLDSVGWDHNPPAPRLPAEVVESTRQKYVEAYERMTGDSFEAYLRRYSSS